MRISELKNLGAASERRLAAIGIKAAEELERVGALEAYRRVNEAFPRETTIVWYYALEGALLDVLWNELPSEVVAKMKEEARRI